MMREINFVIKKSKVDDENLRSWRWKPDEKKSIEVFQSDILARTLLGARTQKRDVMLMADDDKGIRGYLCFSMPCMGILEPPFWEDPFKKEVQVLWTLFFSQSLRSKLKLIEKKRVDFYFYKSYCLKEWEQKMRKKKKQWLIMRNIFVKNVKNGFCLRTLIWRNRSAKIVKREKKGKRGVRGRLDFVF